SKRDRARPLGGLLAARTRPPNFAHHGLRSSMIDLMNLPASIAAGFFLRTADQAAGRRLRAQCATLAGEQAERAARAWKARSAAERRRAARLWRPAQNNAWAKAGRGRICTAVLSNGRSVASINRRVLSIAKFVVVPLLYRSYRTCTKIRH